MLTGSCASGGGASFATTVTSFVPLLFAAGCLIYGSELLPLRIRIGISLDDQAVAMVSLKLALALAGGGGGGGP